LCAGLCPASGAVFENTLQYDFDAIRRVAAGYVQFGTARRKRASWLDLHLFRVRSFPDSPGGCLHGIAQTSWINGICISAEAPMGFCVFPRACMSTTIFDGNHYGGSRKSTLFILFAYQQHSCQMPEGDCSLANQSISYNKIGFGMP
jgi:hypothetical protein